MKLTIINGSPRGKSSNTKILTDHLTNGFVTGNHENEVVAFFLKTNKQTNEIFDAMTSSDFVILAIPLYTDAMPGIVKEFLEELWIRKINLKNKKLGFILQCGFPESDQMIPLRNYLEKAVKKLEVDYLGTILKAGVEGIKIQPKWMIKYTNYFYWLGISLADQCNFDPKAIKKLAGKGHNTFARKIIFQLLRKTKLINYYWDHQLKQNKVFDQRFAQPYYN